MAQKNAQPPKDVATQTEPNGTDKPLPRGSTSGSDAVHGGEAAKPGQMVHDGDIGPKD